MTTRTGARTRAKTKAAQQIIDRVGKVPGWRIVETAKGYEIISPRLDAVPVYVTSRDWNFEAEIWRALDGAGFPADEEQAQRDAAAQEAADAAAAAAKVKAKNAAAAKKAAAAAAAKAKLVKAAGPYLIDAEDVEWEWFTRKHPAPWMRWVKITPALARHILENHNTHNRPIYRRAVEEYRAKIRAGQWVLTHQGMAMDTDAVLQDAQHRLKAIELEGEANPDLVIATPFFVGMPPENFKHVDEGRNRRAQDLLGRDGESYATITAGATRLVLAYDHKVPRQAIKSRTANATIYERFAEDSQELRNAARFASAHYKKLYVGPSPLAAAYYLLREKNGRDNPFLEAFLDGLVKGHKPDRRLLDVLDPREVLREQFKNWRIARKRVDGLSTLCLIILAWNNVVLNREPRAISFTERSDIPEVLLCLPQQSACPSALLGEIPRGEAASPAAALDAAA